MRLPRITIEYQEEETCAPGKLSFALIAGFGLHWAWVYLFMFDGAQLFFIGKLETSFSDDAVGMVALSLFFLQIFGGDRLDIAGQVSCSRAERVDTSLCVVDQDSRDLEKLGLSLRVAFGYLLQRNKGVVLYIGCVQACCDVFRVHPKKLSDPGDVCFR